MNDAIIIKAPDPLAHVIKGVNINVNTHALQSSLVMLADGMLLTHLFLRTPMYTWRAKRANTMRQNTVSVITSTSCLMLLRRALMIVFSPGGGREEGEGQSVSSLAGGKWERMREGEIVCALLQLLGEMYNYYIEFSRYFSTVTLTLMKCLVQHFHWCKVIAKCQVALWVHFQRLNPVYYKVIVLYRPQDPHRRSLNSLSLDERR